MLGELFASVWLKRRNQIREGRIIQETEGTIAVTEEAGITTIGETIIEEEDMVAAETGIVIEGTIADTTGEMVDIIAEVGETTMTAGVGTAAVEADMKTDEGEVMMIEEDTTTDEAKVMTIGYDDRRGGGYDDRRGGGYGDRHGSYEDRKGGDGGNRYEDRRAPPLE